VLLDKDQSQAQELFLRSSQPLAALEMRKDLKHWCGRAHSPAGVWGGVHAGVHAGVRACPCVCVYTCACVCARALMRREGRPDSMPLLRTCKGGSRAPCPAHLAHRSKALTLAEKLDPSNIADICKEHAASLELVGEYAQASSHYQQVGRRGLGWCAWAGGVTGDAHVA